MATPTFLVWEALPLDLAAVGTGGPTIRPPQLLQTSPAKDTPTAVHLLGVAGNRGANQALEGIRDLTEEVVVVATRLILSVCSAGPWISMNWESARKGYSLKH